MKTKIVFILLIFSFQINYSQKTVKMITEYGSKNTEISNLMLFQNIESEKISFESSEIKGKFYEINLKEFKNGKLVNTKNLFDLKIVDYLKIDSTYTSFNYFSKIEDDKMVVFIQTPHAYSEKMTFKLTKGKGSDYVLKDFQRDKEFLSVSLNEEFPILTIITPVKQENGRSSYCEVAQSEIVPEKYWEKFKIPHYFVISVKFK